jgi:cation diffusion facilitator family transporter
MTLNKYNAPKIAIATAALLTIGKGIAGFLSGSLVVIGSAMDSMLDILASSLNYIMIRKADAPPDNEHPFGHGKFEAYASLMQSVLIMAIGGLLLFGAYRKFQVPELPEVTTFSTVVMVLSILASIFITLILRHTAKKENSQALRADALHYFVDVAGNSCVLAVLIIVKVTGASWVDPIFGAAIAIYIIISAVRLHISTLRIMLDTSIPEDRMKKIVEVLEKFNPYQLDYHRLRTRTDGNKVFADVHITLCKKLTLTQSHAFMDIVEAAMPHDGIDLVIHAEPCECDCETNLECKRVATLELLEEKSV